MPFKPQMKRTLLLSVGVLCVVLGTIGIFVPLLPTVPFMIAAAACFGYTHKHWEDKLLNHPRYGETIRAWREAGAIPRKAKWMATALMAFSAALSWWQLPLTVAWLPSAVGVAVAAWMWSRPER